MTDSYDAVELAAELTAAWLANPNTRMSPEDVPAFLASMHQAVIGLTAASSDEEPAAEEPSYAPAVSSRKSLASPDHIISMIDGKSYKTLGRHLSSNGLTPEQYRDRYKLKADYPMVATSYSEARRAMAKAIGLGRKSGAKVAKKSDVPPAKTRKPRKTAASASES